MLHPLDLGALGDLLPPLQPLVPGVVGASPSSRSKPALEAGAWPQERWSRRGRRGCPQDGSSSACWATKPGVPVLTAEGRWPEDEGLTPRDIQKAPLGTVGAGSSGTWGCCECANLPPALILARRVGLGLFHSSPPAPFSSCETRTVSPSPTGRLWDFLLSSTSRERRALPYSHHQLVKVTPSASEGHGPRLPWLGSSPGS